MILLPYQKYREIMKTSFLMFKKKNYNKQDVFIIKKNLDQ